MVQVGTAGHGGIHLDSTLNNAVHPAWRKADGWYEEDCEWAIIATTHPDAFTPQQRDIATRTAKEYFPDQYETATGDVVMPEESSQRFRHEYITAHDGSPIMTTATVRPDGLVQATSFLGADNADAGTPRQTWLLTQAQYHHVLEEAREVSREYTAERASVPAVLNPDVHTQYADGHPDRIAATVMDMPNHTKVQFLNADGTVDSEGIVRDMPHSWTDSPTRRVTMTSRGWGGSELFLDGSVVQSRGWAAVRSVPADAEPVEGTPTRN